jgi:hypothetical protein
VGEIMTFREGDIVRVPGERGTAEIRAVIVSMNKVMLKEAIGGFRNWHHDEIRLVQRGKPKKTKKVGGAGAGT